MGCWSRSAFDEFIKNIYYFYKFSNFTISKKCYENVRKSINLNDLVFSAKGV